MTPFLVEIGNIESVTLDAVVFKSYLWCLQLDHIGFGDAEAIVTKNFANNLDFSLVKHWEPCGRCALDKQTRVQFQSASTD